MDGFYVAKIQKLSDRRPGEEKKSGAVDADIKVDEKDSGVQVSDEDNASGSDEETPTKKKYAKAVPGKKRKKGQNDQVKKKPKVFQRMSVPPTKPKQKAKKLNAKMTKPRRQKQGKE